MRIFSQRRGLQRDGIVVGIGYHAPYDDFVTAVDVEGIVIVVIAVEHLDSLNLQTVAGQIMLHPTAAVPKGDVPDGDILALDEAEQVGTGDALIVPGEFLEGPSSSVDSPETADGDVVYLVGIDELDGGGLCAEGDIV